MLLITKKIFPILIFAFASMGEKTIYVSPSGSDNASGTANSPLKTINAAIGKIPKNSNEHLLIILHGSTYNPGGGIVIDSIKNLTINAAPNENVLIAGGTELDLKWAQNLTDEDIAIGIPEEYRGSIKKLPLQKFGIMANQIWNEQLLSKSVLPELFYGSSKLELSRWPKEDYGLVKEITPCTDSSKVEMSIVNSPFTKNNVNNGLLFLGYWYTEWRANYLMPDRYDQARNVFIISLKKSFYNKFKSGQRLCVLNFTSGLTKPGSWAIDPSKGNLYVWLPQVSVGQKLIITTNSMPLFQIKSSSNVTIQGINFSASTVDAIQIINSDNITVRKCSISDVNGNGIIINNSRNCLIEQNEIKDIGNNAISCNSTGENNLIKAGNYIAGNTISNWGIIVKSYSAAINLCGCGNYALFNSLHTAPHCAVFIYGNSHLLAYNDISDVCKEVQDMGIIYTGQNWTARGITIIQNYLHESGVNDINAIYLDDMTSGTVVQNNFIENVPAAFKLGGGRDIKYEGNTAVNCTRWILADNRAMWNGLNFQTYTLPGGICYERLISKPYKTAPWTTTYPALQFILDDNPTIPKGNIICKNVIVGNQKSSISKEIPQYGLVDSNQIVNSIADAEAFLKKKNYGFVGKDKVGAKAYTPGMYASIKPDFRQPLLPILQKALVSGDKVTFVFASTSYLSKMNVTLKQISTGKDLQKLYTSANFDTITFKAIAGDMVMRARYIGIEGVLDNDFIEYRSGNYSTDIQNDYDLSDANEAKIPSKLAITSSHFTFAKNGNFKISFAIPDRKSEQRINRNNPVRVKMELFNLLGKKVTTVFDKMLMPGFHDAYWDGKIGNGLPLNNNIYYLILTNGHEQDAIQFTKTGSN